MTSNLERVLRVLDRPGLLRLAEAYDLVPPRALPGRDSNSGLPVTILRALIEAHDGVDVVEIVRYVLDRGDLGRVALAFDVPTDGTQAQLKRRLAAVVRWRAFEAAAAHARSAGLRSLKEWGRYVSSGGSETADLPSHPEVAYRGRGWTNSGDFLGTGSVQPRLRTFLPFAEARDVVRGLGLVSHLDFQAWCRGDRPDLLARPDNVPTAPHDTYRDEWTSWGDFLGTGTRSNADKRASFLAFARARSYVRKLRLRSAAEWRAWVTGRLPGQPSRPSEIPAKPQVTYRDAGWRDWGDWLGTGSVGNGSISRWSFAQARSFVRSLQLRRYPDWRAYCRGDLPDLPPRPSQIPTNPNRAYAGEWRDWGDWLGKPDGTGRPWRAFTRARAFARTLSLRTGREWKAYAAGRRPDLPAKPDDIPATPHQIYAGRGWAGFPDFLGSLLRWPR